MTRLLFFLPITFLFVACGGSESSEHDGETVEIDSNYCSCSELTFDEQYNHFWRFERREGFTGKCEEFFPSGKPEYEKNFVDGKMTGRYISYHENGQIWRDRSYTENFQDGPSLTYSKSGKLIAHAEYNRGTLKEMVFEDRSISIDD